MTTQKPIKKIMIVGGGSAGWMAALIIAHSVKAKNIEVTVIESPTVGVIGVGEGSTPVLKKFFDNLGIQESEWMPECNATYKSGISFDGWSTKPGHESYFHPFVTMIDNLTLPVFINNVKARLNGEDVCALPDKFFLSSKLAESHLAPIASHNFPFFTTYGYHFDAMLLGKFLHKKALEMGIRHISAHITDTRLDAAGNIASVLIEGGDPLEADFFVDCSGFAALLIGKALKTPFVSYADHLLNDSAIAMPTDIGAAIPTQTISTAMKYGWSWKIPLQNRYGNGYVYSSAFTTADQAEKELREKLGLLESDTQARHLKMKLGRVEKHWNKNCLAVGLSQGFLEPLEATALYLTQMTAAIFCLFLEKGDMSEQAQNVYNQQINDYFDGHRNYIIAHYKTNSRTDTEYWKANAANLHTIPDSLKQVFATWLEGRDLGDEIRRQKIDTYYPVASWYSLLAGMGVFPQADKAVADAVQNRSEPLGDFIQRCALNFQDHRSFLSTHRPAM
ncbi:tryptophan halogenase family protein [Undibacterium sp. Ji83W]|uniref:tryptophan halogenase family protein n=1 Tax=Undibacterium sp. Ji83W TaxID=3413043 RepID=UPI003BF09B24